MMMKAGKRNNFLGVSLPFLRPMPGPVRSVPPQDAAAIPHARVSIHVTFGFHHNISIVYAYCHYVPSPSSLERAGERTNLVRVRKSG